MTNNFSPSPSNFHILLVEDHEDTRAILLRLMVRWGYTVTQAGSVQEARRRLDDESFDLLLCDIGLPDGSGTEVAEHLRARSTIPAVAMSGYGMETDLENTRRAGFSKHIVKPVIAEELRQLLLVHASQNGEIITEKDSVY